jgi:drug/metabolite transporter (DMT)-like permease
VKLPTQIELFPLENNEHLDSKAMIVMIILTLIWGLNTSIIKYTTRGISTVFSSALRSIIASICGVLYCLCTRQKLFHTNIMILHGLMIGLLYGLEFAFLYFGMLYTDVARSVLFLNLSPFVVAVGAHVLLKGDRLTLLKVLGLVLAFTGILIVFHARSMTANSAMWVGDVLEIMAGIFWGATTLYIKRFVAEKIRPINTFLYQVLFSIPVLFIVSFILQPRWVYKVDSYIVAAVLYRSVINGFISPFIWFKLIHAYSVSRLSAVTFLTPIFGVFFVTIFLNEEFTVSLMVGLPMVCLGIFLVNQRRREHQSPKLFLAFFW